MTLREKAEELSDSTYNTGAYDHCDREACSPVVTAVVLGLSSLVMFAVYVLIT